MARQAGNDTWRARIIKAFERLGGSARYADLYAELGKQQRAALTVGERGGVRKEIQNCSSDSANYRSGGPDLFRSVGGARSGHWGLRNSTVIEIDDLDFREGERRLSEVTLIARSHGLVAAAKQKLGFNCVVCGFNFELNYGIIGRAYVEVHHLNPISTHDPSKTLNVKDVTVLCSNCHRMAHTSDPPLTPLALKKAVLSARRKLTTETKS